MVRSIYRISGNYNYNIEVNANSNQDVFDFQKQLRKFLPSQLYFVTEQVR